MENKKTEGETSAQGTQSPKKEAKLQFTMGEILEMIAEPKLAGIVENLSKEEDNKGQAGSYLLKMAKGVLKQLTLM